MLSLFEEMMVETGLGTADLMRIISSAPARYKHYLIPKKHGGHRLIAQPSRELKMLQRFVMGRVLKHFPIHKSAAAYVHDRSISDNAALHRSSSVILKLDFENFFPSITAMDWRKYLRKNEQIVLEPQDVEILTRILFWGRKTRTPKCLSIGAPTSPMLSNILMFSLDDRISTMAAKTNVTYSRYADDITLSGQSIARVAECESLVRKEIGRTKSPALKFNEGKRGLYTKGQRRLVTGLIITPTHRVSIGRQRKRMISALVHKFILGLLEMEKVAFLKGMLAFAHDSEPEFVDRLRQKYGEETIKQILSIHLPRRSAL